MPIINFHLSDTPANRAGAEKLLKSASALYAEVLKAPIGRIRAFITMHPQNQFLVSGELCSESGANAPFFDFIVLDGRPLEERERLHAGFTDLLVDILGVHRGSVRGICRRVPPEDWSIGGVLASELRRSEIEARAQAAQGTASA